MPQTWFSQAFCTFTPALLVPASIFAIAQMVSTPTMHKVAQAVFSPQPSTLRHPCGPGQKRNQSVSPEPIADSTLAVQIASWGWTIAIGLFCTGVFALGFFMGAGGNRPGVSSARESWLEKLRRLAAGRECGSLSPSSRTRTVMSSMPEETLEGDLQELWSPTGSRRRRSHRRRTAFCDPLCSARGQRRLRQRQSRQRFGK